MSRSHSMLVIRKPGLTIVACLAGATLAGCLNRATLTGEPSYVGSDPSGRSVYQAPLWGEGGGYFVYDNGGRVFLGDR